MTIGDLDYSDFSNNSEDVDRSADPEAVADFVSFLTGIQPELPACELVPVSPSPADLDSLKLDRITDEVLAESMGMIRAGQKFYEVEPMQTEPCEEWVRTLGRKEAKRQFAIAQAANLPTREVPYGLKMSVDIASGILKSRASRPQARQLNVQFIQIQAPTFSYPSKRVDK